MANSQGFRIGAPEGWPLLAKSPAVTGFMASSGAGRHWVRCDLAVAMAVHGESRRLIRSHRRRSMKVTKTGQKVISDR
jgi:hypothetical protein